MRDTKTWLMAFMRHIETERKDKDILTNCPKICYPEIAERLIVVMNGLYNLIPWFSDNDHVEDAIAIKSALNILEDNFGINCNHGRAKSIKKYELDDIKLKADMLEWCKAPEDTEILTLNC